MEAHSLKMMLPRSAKWEMLLSADVSFVPLLPSQCGAHITL